MVKTSLIGHPYTGSEHLRPAYEKQRRERQLLNRRLGALVVATGLVLTAPQAVSRVIDFFSGDKQLTAEEESTTARYFIQEGETIYDVVQRYAPEGVNVQEEAYRLSQQVKDARQLTPGQDSIVLSGVLAENYLAEQEHLEIQRLANEPAIE